MSDFKLCENGHYYPRSQAFCPYCPKPSADDEDQQFMRTMMQGDDDSPFGGGQGGFDFEPEPKPRGRGNLGRTQIFSEDSSSPFNNPNFGSPPKQIRQNRKLVGWLVSFTIDEFGKDFQLYEGRNTIGSAYDCDIQVEDPAVSSKHLTILHRMGHFKFKDELSTNGTFINDVFEEEGNLKDGDMIRIGDTIFKFRSIA